MPFFLRWTPLTELSLLAGKKQFNSIVSFLNTEGSKNGGVKEMLSGRPEAAIKGVRAKREADEAGTFHCPL